VLQSARFSEFQQSAATDNKDKGKETNTAQEQVTVVKWQLQRRCGISWQEWNVLET